jgi:hypothetical protein
MRVRPSVPLSDQGDWVPQFATSPAALEMYPEVEETTDEAAGPEEEADADPLIEEARY